jgi:CspA family cold shock protein
LVIVTRRPAGVRPRTHWEQPMATGTVRSFNPSKGFGLITPDLGGPPVFARESAIATPGLKKLVSLQRVRYDLLEAAEGLFALNIHVVTD